MDNSVLDRIDREISSIECEILELELSNIGDMIFQKRRIKILLEYLEEYKHLKLNHTNERVQPMPDSTQAPADKFTNMTPEEIQTATHELDEAMEALDELETT